MSSSLLFLTRPGTKAPAVAGGLAQQILYVEPKMHPYMAVLVVLTGACGITFPTHRSVVQREVGSYGTVSLSVLAKYMTIW